MGEVIAFAEVVRARRVRAARSLHRICRGIIAETVCAARAELASAPVGERQIRLARLRKLEELEAYATAIG